MRRNAFVVMAVGVLALSAVGGCVHSTPDSAAAPSGSVAGSPSDGPSAADSTPSGTVSGSPTPGGQPAAPGPTASGARPPQPGGSIPAPVVPPPPPPPPLPNSDQLRAALLTGGDLGGFSGGSGGEESGAGGCSLLDSDISSGATAKAEVLLQKSSSGPYVRERLRQLSAAEAGKAVGRIRSAASGCSPYTVTDPNVGKIDYSFGAVSVGRYGDESASVRVTGRLQANPSVAVYSDIVAIRRGGILILLTHTAAPSIDTGLTSSAAGKAYNKVAARW